MNRIAELRKKNNYTQKQLAKKLNINAVTLSRYETGNRTPPIDTLKMMSDIFMMPIEYIMGESVTDKYIEALKRIASNVDSMTNNIYKMYIEAFYKLNDEGQKELFKYAEYLASQEEYTASRELTIKVGDKKIPPFDLNDYEVQLVKKIFTD